MKTVNIYMWADRVGFQAEKVARKRYVVTFEGGWDEWEPVFVFRLIKRIRRTADSACAEDVGRFHD